MVAVAPVLTRLFAPEAFGVAALFASITGIVSIVACVRYELAIMLPKSSKEASNLLGGSLFFVLIITGVIVLIILCAADRIGQLFNSPELEKYLWLIPISVFANGTFLALNYWNSRTKHFARLSIARVISSTATAFGSLGAGLNGFVNGGPLIATRVLGQTMSTVVLGLQIWKSDRGLFNENIRWDKMIAGLKRYKNFPIYNSWSALLNTTSQFLPTLFLAYFFSPRIVGFYALSLQVLFLPTSLIGQAVGQVFFQKASEANGQGQLDMVVEGVFRRLVSVGMFPFLLLILLGKDLFLFVFGSQWSEAGIFVQMLSCWIFFAFLYSPLSLLFVVLEAQREALLVDVILFGSRCVALAIGGYWGNPRIAVALFSFVGSSILCFMILRFFWRVRIPPQKPLVVLGQHLLVLCPMLLIVLWSNCVMKNRFLVTLWISALCGIAYYAVVLYRDVYLRKQLMVLCRSVIR